MGFPLTMLSFLIIYSSSDKGWGSKNRYSLLLAMFLFFTAIGDLPAQESPRSPLVLRAAVPRDFPPYYLIDDAGQPTGFAIDLMNLIADRAGFDISYVVKEHWADVNKALRAGEVDLIPNLGITEERMEFYSFTSPVHVFPVSIFVLKGTRGINSIDDLGGKKVGVVRTNVAITLLQNQEDIVLNVFDTPVEALFELLAGGVEALVYPEPVLEELTSRIDVENDIKMVGEPLIIVRRAIAVQKGNESLLHALNEAVKHIIETPVYKHTYSKWFGEAKPFWTLSRVAVGMGGCFSYYY